MKLTERRLMMLVNEIQNGEIERIQQEIRTLCIKEDGLRKSKIRDEIAEQISLSRYYHISDLANISELIDRELHERKKSIREYKETIHRKQLCLVEIRNLLERYPKISIRELLHKANLNIDYIADWEQKEDFPREIWGLNHIASEEEIKMAWYRLLYAILEEDVSATKAARKFDGKRDHYQLTAEEYLAVFKSAKKHGVPYRTCEEHLGISHTYGCKLRKRWKKLSTKAST